VSKKLVRLGNENLGAEDQLKDRFHQIDFFDGRWKASRQGMDRDSKLFLVKLWASLVIIGVVLLFIL
jgi:hypothetical protein